MVREELGKRSCVFVFVFLVWMVEIGGSQSTQDCGTRQE